MPLPRRQLEPEAVGGQQVGSGALGNVLGGLGVVGSDPFDSERASSFGRPAPTSMVTAVWTEMALNASVTTATVSVRFVGGYQPRLLRARVIGPGLIAWWTMASRCAIFEEKVQLRAVGHPGRVDDSLSEAESGKTLLEGPSFRSGGVGPRRKLLFDGYAARTMWAFKRRCSVSGTHAGAIDLGRNRPVWPIGGLLPPQRPAQQRSRRRKASSPPGQNHVHKPHPPE